MTSTTTKYLPLLQMILFFPSVQEDDFKSSEQEWENYESHKKQQLAFYGFHHNFPILIVKL